MFELLVPIPAALLRFKDLEAVSNSSEWLVASLKDMKYSVKLAETSGMVFEREGPTFVKKDLISFAISCTESVDFLVNF